MGGRTEEGIEQARRALRIQPKFMLPMHNLAVAYLTRKDFVRARFWLREALDIEPDDPQLRQLQVKIRIAAFLAWAREWPRRILGIGKGKRER
jgi:tetratricopeptide (TPR) repeat protein